MQFRLNDAAEYFHRVSRERGWWKEGETNNPYIIATKIALIHSEISEALERYRTDSRDDHLIQRLGIEVELVDALIRIFDLAGALKLDLDGTAIEKDSYNSFRKDHQEVTRLSKGGKKF